MMWDDGNGGEGASDCKLPAFFEATLPFVSRRATRSDTFRKWAVACSILALALAVVEAERFADDAYLELRVVPEPTGWSEWPILPHLDGYELSYDGWGCVDGFRNAYVASNIVLNDRRGLLPKGVSLDAWYGGERTYESRPLTTPSIRGKGEIRVVTAIEPRSNTDTFVVAFERGATSHSFEFRHPGSEGFVFFVGAALALLLGLALAGSRYVVASRAFQDPSRFRPGFRDAFHKITFYDGTPPIVHGDDVLRRASAGPVLVRVVKVEPGTYRSLPTAHSKSVLDGDAQTLALSRMACAASAMRIAFVAATILVLLAVFVIASQPCGEAHWAPGAFR